MSNSTFRSWRDMLDRCYSRAHVRFPEHGGRGVTVTYRWREYDNFVADMGEQPKGRKLTRVNSDRGYLPDNCRWA